MTSSILNGAEFTHTALQESDDQAFRQMLTKLVKPQVPVEGFVYTGVTQDPSDSSKALLTAGILPAQAPISQWGYQDTIELSYRRVGVSALFARFGQSVRIDIPTTVREVMKVYFSATGLHDRSDQFVDGPVEELGTVMIQVIPEQFLLHGAAALDVKPQQRQLNVVLPVAELSGFRTPADFNDPPLSTLFHQLTDLNGGHLPYPLQPEWMQIGNPAVLGGYAHDNAQVTLTAFGEGFYIGDRVLTYSRLDFGWYTMGNQIFMEGPSMPTMDYILDQVTMLTGFPLSSDDVQPRAFDPVGEGMIEVLTIVFKPQNLRYVGELTIDYKAV